MLGRLKVPTRSQELVFLDPDDDLGAIRSKLDSSSAEEVYLVIPRKSAVLRSPLDFRILARIANELPSETIIVTGDGNRRRLAQQEGFRTKRSLRTLKHLMLGPGQQPPPFILPDWAPGLASSIVIVALLLAGAVLVLVAVPIMRVTLAPRTIDVNSKELQITVDPAAQAADSDKGILPGEVLSQRIEVQDTLPVAGVHTVGRDRARGEVVMVSQRPAVLTLPKGTRVMVEGGPKFTLDQDIGLRPNIPVRAGITAVEPGSESNVSAGAISGFDELDATDLRVTNQRPTSGGTDRQAKVVTEDEIGALREQLLMQARRDALAQLKILAGQERSVVEQSLSVTQESEKFDEPGTETDLLAGRLAVQASATVFHNLRFNELVGQMLARRAGEGLGLRGAPELDPPAVVDVQGQKVTLATRASGRVVRDLDRTAVEKDLRGMSLQEARAYVDHLTGLAQSQVEMEPSWWPSWAQHPLRVDVTIQTPR
jgi:Baseplate J-like protein